MVNAFQVPLIPCDIAHKINYLDWLTAFRFYSRILVHVLMQFDRCIATWHCGFLRKFFHMKNEFLTGFDYCYKQNG